jgi:hypothetical protein
LKKNNGHPKGSKKGKLLDVLKDFIYTNQENKNQPPMNNVLMNKMYCSNYSQKTGNGVKKEMLVLLCFY